VASSAAHASPIAISRPSRIARSDADAINLAGWLFQGVVPSNMTSIIGAVSTSTSSGAWV
jgi:hypothetical protein